MEKYFSHDLIIGIIQFQAVILLIVLSNIWLTHRARRHPLPPTFPLVSILVPARNEDQNVAACIGSLLIQDYPSYEVLVLDDQSTDNTRGILENIAASNPKLTVLDGQPPLEDQVGKNWACTQLANQAKGEVLLFTDSDTIHQPNMLKAIITALQGERADLLTGFPRQYVETWGERLLVPFFSWAMICFNPLWLAYRLHLPALTTAVGQMMIFRRDAYFAVGGHNIVSTSIIDDLALARQIKSSGYSWRVAYISDLISCRMYHSSSEAYQGFVKNLFAVFDFRLLPYLFVFLWLLVVFWVPLIVLFLMIFGLAPSAQLFDLAFCIGLSIAIWMIPYLEIQVPIALAFLYPITMLAKNVVAFQSLRHTISGKLFWKGRKIPKQNWKLL